MKIFFSLIAAMLLALPVYADDVSDLMGLGMPGALASEVVSIATNPSSITTDDVTISGSLTLSTAAERLKMPPYVATMAATPVAGTNIVNQLTFVPTAAANTAALLPATPVPGECYKVINSTWNPNAIRVKAGGAAGINGGGSGTFITVGAGLTAECCAGYQGDRWHCTLQAQPTPG